MKGAKGNSSFCAFFQQQIKCTNHFSISASSEAASISNRDTVIPVIPFQIRAISYIRVCVRLIKRKILT